MITVNPSNWKDWVWPVPIWKGRIPVISDAFDPDDDTDDGHREHLGVDITFRKGPLDPPGTNEHDMTKLFISPGDTPVIAAGPGKIWSAKLTPLGYSVQIDHGMVGSAGGVNSFYQHLASLHRPWKKGDIVRPGDILGVMGYDLRPEAYKFRHLHFELWFPTRSRARNPAPYMRHWKKITLPLGVINA